MIIYKNEIVVTHVVKFKTFKHNSFFHPYTDIRPVTTNK